jgi:hypothetical protein
MEVDWTERRPSWNLKILKFPKPLLDDPHDILYLKEALLSIFDP